MPTLLDVTDNSVGTRKRVYGPCSVFVEGTIGGGTVTLSACRESDGELVTVETITSESVVTDNIIGPHYLQATLAGATTPDLVVRTL